MLKRALSVCANVAQSLKQHSNPWLTVLRGRRLVKTGHKLVEEGTDLIETGAAAIRAEHALRRCAQVDAAVVLDVWKKAHHS